MLTDAAPPAACLKIFEMHFRYGPHRPVLNGINLTVQSGEWVAVLGPNASGKTTLLHCAVGLLRPAGGRIVVCGHDLKLASRAARRELGFATPPEWLPGLLTGRHCLEIYAAAKGLPAISPEILGLAEELRCLPVLDQFVATYSFGTRQKLAVLSALLGEPRLVVLDEAFNGLDPGSSLTIKRYLRSRVSDRGCSVLLATHALDLVERYADRAALLLDGRIVHEWTSAEIRKFTAQASEGFEIELAARSESKGPRYAD